MSRYFISQPNRKMCEGPVDTIKRRRLVGRSLVIVVICIGVLSVRSYGLEGNGGYDAPYFQADFVQDLSDFSSGIVNPALLYRVNQLRVEAGFYRWNVEADLNNKSLGYQEFSFLIPLRLNHTIGLSLIGTTQGIDKTRIGDGPSYDMISDGGANYGDLWLIGHYSYRILPWFIVGTNLKLRNEYEFGNGTGWGFGADVGFYFNPLDHYRYGDVGLSLNFQDIVPTQVAWKGTTPSSVDTSTNVVSVTRLRFGARYSGLNDKLIVDGEGLVDNAFSDLWKGAMGSDSLTANMLRKAFRMSFHVKWEFIPQLWLKAGWMNNNIPYVGFNYNVIYSLPEMINYLNYDFHLGYSVMEPERGFTMMNKLSTDFGPTREQRESKRLYDQLILAPMDAYNEAMRLYLAGKYWEASYAFGKVISLYPNFYLNDKATFYMGNCYRFLQMNETAREVYKGALEEYTTSDMRPKYLYGLENIDYREGKYEEALKNHAFITNLYAESEIRPDADYLAGEIHFLRKNYTAAEQLLSKLRPGDPSYLYAQYTLSIINVENKKMEAAVGNLKSIVGDTTQDVGVQLLQDAANTKLGHLYFEQVELRNAVEAYKRVPEGSSYGDEALLGTAWSWIKVNQAAVSLQTIERLLASHPESPLVPEAYLLKGYGLMLQKSYTEASSALEKCLELTKGTFVTEADLAAKGVAFKQTEQAFGPTAEKIRKNALRKPTDKTIEERGAFKTEFDKFSKESRDYFNFQLLAKSHRKFFMRKDEVVQDAEYALAKTSSILKGKKQNEIIDKGQQEQKKIDSQIEELQKKLKEQNKK
jgi:tetratricopeptide (TPR) repeat protein